MLIKEYRIPLPMTVEEYRIAQLYMIQKKSREESEGEGSAVEIIENRPYSDGPNGSGQYTYKIYHIGRHVPSWFRSIAPKTALEVHEEAWNAYPYTKTRFSVPFVEKFSLEVETIFEPDSGVQENIFKLTGSELRQREMDVIDIVNNQLSGSDYKQEEDPSYYVSQKTGRGPLSEDWIKNPPDGVIMCSYKLIKVEFKYWGLQSKIERFIHDYGLRRVMLRAHRQAWAWQDEWVGLTMEDIRRLERETQLILQQKLGRVPEALPEGEEEEDAIPEEDLVEVQDEGRGGGLQMEATGSSISSSVGEKPEERVTSPIKNEQKLTKKNSLTTQSSTEGGHQWERRISSRRLKRDRGSVRSTRSGTMMRRMSSGNPDGTRKGSGAEIGELPHSQANSLLHMSLYHDSDDESMYSSRPEWALDQIAMLSDSDSEQEFFDAKESVSSDEHSDHEYQEAVSEVEAPPTDLPLLAQAMAGGAISNSLQDLTGYSGDELEMTPAPSDVLTPMLGASEARTLSPMADILFLIIYGGSFLDCRLDQVGQKIDFQTISENVRNIVELHFQSAQGRIVLRMVPCPNICNSALQLLCDLSPGPMSTQECGVGLLPPEITRRRPSQGSIRNLSVLTGAGASNEGTSVAPSGSIPVGVIPLLATQCYGYSEMLHSVSAAANSVYEEFLKSEEGRHFSGQVCLLTDCMGSVVTYDILTSGHTPSHPPHSPLSPHSKHLSAPPLIYPPQSSAYCTPPRTRVHTCSLPEVHEEGGSSGNKPPSLTARTPPPEIHLKEAPHPLLIQKQASLGSLSSSSSSLTSINNTTLIFPPSPDHKGIGFVFDVSHFFAFGSPLGLVLASRRAKSKKLSEAPPLRPHCTSFYNLFYAVDPIASRIEPLLDERFSKVPPVTVPRYRLYPIGISQSSSLKETVARLPYLFGSQQRSSLQAPSIGGGGGALSKKKSVSSECLVSKEDNGRRRGWEEMDALGDIKPFSAWWSANRIDYFLEAPRGSDGFGLLPPAAFAHIVHSRYWEAKELVSFILRQVLHHATAVCVKQMADGKELTPFSPLDSVVKWNKKTTTMKIQKLGPNHRASDAVIPESGTPPAIVAKFLYGPLDMVTLAREMVDVYILMQRPKPKWEFFDTLTTDKHGRVSYTLPEEKTLPPGHYPMKFLVKGDHTAATCNLFVVPPHTEAVVFSLDGALTSNLSLRGKDIKMKPGAVEVARCWQELGYLLIYITGRPDMQKDHVLSFLGAHGFPLGLVSCADSISTDSHHKTLYLARLIKEAKVIIHAAYGSHRHLGGYKELGLQPDQIFIHGKRSRSTTKKPVQDCQYLPEGFASHLAKLKASPPRRAMFDVKRLLGDVCFALPGNQKPEGSKKKQSRSGSTYRNQNQVLATRRQESPLETTV